MAARARVLRHPTLELGLVVVHIGLFVGAVLWLLPFWLAAAFILVSQLVLGIGLGAVFAPNHKGMLVYRDEDELDWLHRQVLTSRNIRSGRLIVFLFGGLNYQIEHHLFPSMPRIGLRRVRPIVIFAGPDDLATLVGNRLGASEFRSIEQDQISAFAAVTGDRQWIHTDPGRAAQGPFGRPIAHGMLTLSLGIVLLDEVFRVDGINLVLNKGFDWVRFATRYRPAPESGSSRTCSRSIGMPTASPRPSSP